MKHVELARAIYAPTGRPLDYPSAMIAQSTLVLGDSHEEIMPDNNFSSFVDAGGVPVDDRLAALGGAPVARRIAQMAFGAHRNIDNISWKFADYERSTGRRLSRAFVMIPAVLANADVVACNISSGGHMYSGLLATRGDLPFRHYLIGARCPVTIFLFDEEQMKAMHAMNGIPRAGEAPGAIPCSLHAVEVSLSDRIVCGAQTYSVAVPFLGLEGEPIGFSAVSTRGDLPYPRLSQEDMFRRINRLIAAEDAPDGAVPIIDSVNRRRRALLAEGSAEAKRIADDPLFARVKAELTSRMLRDEDGKARRGLEDVYPAIAPEKAWDFAPLYRPRKA